MKRKQLRVISERKLEDVLKWEEKDILSLLNESVDEEGVFYKERVVFNIFAHHNKDGTLMVFVNADSDRTPLTWVFPVSASGVFSK